MYNINRGPIDKLLGDVVLMGTRKSKIRTLFLEYTLIDPVELPDGLQMWYVSIPQPEMDSYGIVSAYMPSREDFTGTLITPKLLVPENGILFNFNPYVLLWDIDSIEDDIKKGRMPDTDKAREMVMKLKMIAHAYGYLDIKPDELQVYECTNEPIMTISEFLKTL